MTYDCIIAASIAAATPITASADVSTLATITTETRIINRHPLQVLSKLFVICLVVLVYVFLGGMRGTAIANTAQTIVFIVLCLITFLIMFLIKTPRNNFGCKVCIGGFSTAFL